MLNSPSASPSRSATDSAASALARAGGLSIASGQEGSAAGPKPPRYESLTAWRGLACLFIIIYHSLFTGYGFQFTRQQGLTAALLAVCDRLWIGVPIFFVISGYCITASADVSRRRAKAGAGFFLRRFRRIYPPYWIWLAVAAAYILGVEHFAAPKFFQNAFVPSPLGLTRWQWLGNLTLTESWRWNLTHGVECMLLSHSWTLCYEEQFYFLVGLVLLFAPRRFFTSLTLITVLVIAGLFLLPAMGIPTWGLFVDGKWLMFASGVLAYYILNYVPASAAAWWSLPLWFGGLCAVAEPGNLLKPVLLEPNQSYLAAFAFALLLIGLHQWDEPLARAVSLRPLRFCGEMCYSLYLIHWPLVTAISWSFGRMGLRSPAAVFLLGLPCCIGVAVAVARLFHLLVERRFLSPSAQ